MGALSFVDIRYSLLVIGLSADVGLDGFTPLIPAHIYHTDIISFSLEKSAQYAFIYVLLPS